MLEYTPPIRPRRETELRKSLDCEVQKFADARGLDTNTGTQSRCDAQQLLNERISIAKRLGLTDQGTAAAPNVFETEKGIIIAI